MVARHAGIPILALLLGAPATGSDLPSSISIPEAEFELGEKDYKPIPMPDLTGNPVDQLMDYLSMDMTGTLPEAVLRQELGALPYDFVDVVWGMEVSGDWGQNHTGSGTLQVTNFTEGRGASPQIDPERFTGLSGFRMYNAQLETDGEHTFTLSAIFPPDAGGIAYGTELDETKGLFEVTWLCHMFEPGQRGCIDHDDEYFYTPLPLLQQLRIQQRGESYRMTFRARVFENRSHRDQGYRISQPSGRFGDVRGWVCDRASWEADPDACISGDPLLVEDNSPSHDRENVNLETPGIEFTFNEPVDIESLEDNFTLSTRDTLGERVEVTGEIQANSPTRFAFIPADKLESGVRYEARIEGREDGVLARDSEEHMDGDHWGRFSTLVDLSSHDGPAEDPVEVDVYQTIKNAPLVAQKPAVLRINAEWQEHPHIHPDWQPTSYEAELETNVVSSGNWHVEAQMDGPVDDNVLRVIRPDQLSDAEIKRQARHTINVYGWEPHGPGGSSDIEVRLRPHDPYPEPMDPQDVIAERSVPNWNIDPAPLVFRYTFLTVGSWEGGVPDADLQAAAGIVRKVEEFAVQTMPVKNAYGIRSTHDANIQYANIHRSNLVAALDAVVRQAEALESSGVTGLLEWLSEAYPGGDPLPGVLSIQAAGIEWIAEHGRPAVNLEALKTTIQKVREDLGAVSGPNDILVVFYPPEFYAVGQTFHKYFSDYAHRGVGMPITTDAPRSALAMGLIHEFGHYYGLHHRPAHSSQLTFPRSAFVDFGIEGYRLAPDGMSGWNKSATEGNAEHPTTLVPTMWPRALLLSEVFVSESDYQLFMSAIAGR